MNAFREVVEQAHGVIAARLEVDADTAADILLRVAQREGLSRDQLAANVVASCTSSHVRVPRDLYTNGYGYAPAA